MVIIYGTTGNDNLIGTQNEDDQIFGFDGNDTLTGARSYYWADKITTVNLKYRKYNSSIEGLDLYDVSSTSTTERIEFGNNDRNNLTDPPPVEEHWTEVDASNQPIFYIRTTTTKYVKDEDRSNDSLDGGNGNDILSDHKGSDTLIGGNGDDFIYTTANTDSAQKTLTGGSGADKFFVDIKGDVTLGLNFDAQRLAQFINDITLPDQDLKNAQLATNLVLGGLGAAGTLLTGGAGFAFSWLTSAISTGIGFGFDIAQVEAQKQSADAAVKSYGNSDWGTVTQTNRDLVTIKDFVIGEDSIVLPAISANSGYQYQAVIGSGGTFIKAKMGSANPTDVIFLENVYRGQTNGLDDAQFTALITDLLNPQTGVIGVFKNTPITGNSSTLEGKFAYDRIDGANSAQQMIGGYGNDVINGNGGDDTLYGGTKSTQEESFNSTLANLYTNDGNDILSGGEGNDLLYGETGDDFLNGGTGFDQAIYAGQYTEFKATILNDGTVQLQDTTSVNGNEGVDILTGVEQINFAGGGVYSIVTGTTGNDTLKATPSYTLMFGDAGNDSLIGGDGPDTLSGGTDNDTLVGGLGNDFLNGGDGYDQAFYRGYYTEFQSTILSDGSIQVQDTSAANGSEGTDTLTGVEWINFNAGGAYGVLTGSTGNDVLNATNAWSLMAGQEGNDRLTGGTGNDTLSGGTDNDTLVGGVGNDLLNGGTGNDQAIYAGYYTEFQSTILSDGSIQVQDTSAANGSEGTDTLTGIEWIIFNAGGAYGVLTGSTGNDVLNATPSYTLMFGDAGHDALLGGNGSDTLSGGIGNDLLIGGAGADCFVFNSVTEGLDAIADFKRFEGDKIQINGASFGATSTTQFSVDYATDALFFNGQKFATVLGITSTSDFNVSTDLMLV